jgi:hypothetical protein
MPTLLTATQLAGFLERHPEFTLEGGNFQVPEDGVIVADAPIGCVFVFDKQDNTRIYANVTDIWTTCIRQVIPTPPSILDELLTFAGEVRQRTETLIHAVLWILAIMLVIQSGILKGIIRE